MADAVVGDDVLGDDPTVKQLESMVAEMCGKESGLFVPSGTMSNAVALKTHTDPGDESLLSAIAIFTSMRWGCAALCGSSIALPRGYERTVDAGSCSKRNTQTKGISISLSRWKPRLCRKYCESWR